ncbi:hypothetical protein DFP72DRAFT_1066170 [Ephemerocybe angulata]|uniref:Uncharacterized protein n=1 Tax=Ephemerocybe angulata TaxID=980116 RepID=A0A8H6MA87_9AGAR|nr:hypothetical protein DFP72DRAFT_1066170 [Tulosesus angulatus]
MAPLEIVKARLPMSPGQSLAASSSRAIPRRIAHSPPEDARRREKWFKSTPNSQNVIRDSKITPPPTRCTLLYAELMRRRAATDNERGIKNRAPPIEICAPTNAAHPNRTPMRRVLTHAELGTQTTNPTRRRSSTMLAAITARTTGYPAIHEFDERVLARGDQRAHR